MKIETTAAFQSAMRDLLKMRDWWKRTYAFGGSTQPKELYQITDLVKVGNDTATALSRGDVLEISGAKILTDVDSTRPPWLVGVKATAGNVVVAVLLEPCRAKDGTKRTIVPAQMSGVCVVNVNVGATWHRRARPVKDAFVLTSGLFGPVEMLSELTTTGEQLVVCSIGHSANRGVFCKTSSAITAAVLTSGRLTLGSGTAKIHDPYSTSTQYDDSTNELTVYNMAGEEVATAWYGRLVPTDDWLPMIAQEPCTAPV